MKSLVLMIILLMVVATKSELFKQFHDFSMITTSARKQSIVQSLKDLSINECVKQCFILFSCVSINYNIKTKECQLSNKNPTPKIIEKASSDWSLLQADLYRELQGEFCLSVNPCEKHQYCVSKQEVPLYYCIENQ